MTPAEQRRWRRRQLLLGLVLAALSPCLPASEFKRLSGQPLAPPVELLTSDGAPFSLSHLRGQVVLINFWATWCEPCVAEMPSLQRLQQTFQGQGVAVVLINYQEGPARIDEFLRKLGLTLSVLRDTDGSVARNWGARIFPATYLVDRAGHIRYAHAGAADWTSADALGIIRAMLAS
ncbi:MAG: TlpA disulfide reductase family protein [Burkholderiaceae bacterium]